jgi:hypothetical protein
MSPRFGPFGGRLRGSDAQTAVMKYVRAVRQRKPSSRRRPQPSLLLQQFPALRGLTLGNAAAAPFRTGAPNLGNPEVGPGRLGRNMPL